MLKTEDLALRKLEHGSSKVWRNYYRLLKQSTQRSKDIQRQAESQRLKLSQDQTNIDCEESKHQSWPTLNKSLSFWAEFLDNQQQIQQATRENQSSSQSHTDDQRRSQNSVHNKQIDRLAHISSDSMHIELQNSDVNLTFDEMMAVNDKYKEAQEKVQNQLIQNQSTQLQSEEVEVEVAMYKCDQPLCPACHSYNDNRNFRHCKRFQDQKIVFLTNPGLRISAGFKSYEEQKNSQNLTAQKQEEYQYISSQVSQILKIFGAFDLQGSTLQSNSCNSSVFEAINTYRLQLLEELITSCQNLPVYSKLSFIAFQFGLSEKLAFNWYLQHKLIIQLLRIQLELQPSIIDMSGKSKEEINLVKEIVDLKEKHSLQLLANMKLSEERQEPPVQVEVIGFTIPDNGYKGYRFDDFQDPKIEECFKNEVELRLRELEVIGKDAVIQILLSKGSIKTSVIVSYLNKRAQYEQLEKSRRCHLIRDQFNATDVHILERIPLNCVEIDNFDLQTREYTIIDSIAGYFASRGPPSERQWYSVPGRPWMKLHLNLRSFRACYGGNQNWYRSGNVVGAWNQGFFCPYKFNTDRINFIIKNRILPFTSYNPYNFTERSGGLDWYPGIYLYQDVNDIFQRCPIINLGNVNYRVAFSCRVDPEHSQLQQSEGRKLYFTFDSSHVRPTAILIRPVE